MHIQEEFRCFLKNFDFTCTTSSPKLILYGSHDCQPYKLGSPLLLIVAEKRASAATRKQIV